MRTKQLRSRLDTQVQLQSPPAADNATIQSDSGEVDRSESNWTVTATAWAEITPDTGGVVVLGEQDVEQQRYRVTVRRGLTFGPGYRLKVLDGRLAGKFLRIESTGRAERDEEEVLICKQGKLP